MTKFTPAPWTLEIDDSAYCIKSAGNHLIATMEGLVGEYEKDKYDVLLMCASPAMYAVCKQVEQVRRLAEDDTCPDLFLEAEVEVLQDMARDALSLADGENDD